MRASSYVARNFLALGSGEIVSRVIAVVVTIYLARILGAKGYGAIAFATGVTLYLSKIADFAIEAIGTKEIASSPESVNHLASAVMSVRLVFAVLLSGVAILVTQLFLPEPERTILSLYFVTLIPIAASTKWIYLGLENARPIGLSRVVGEVLALGIVLVFVRNKDGLWGAPVARIAGELSFAFLLILVLRFRNYKFSFRWDMSTALPIFAQALPLLGQILLALIIYNSDLIFLRVFRDNESVGYYAAAYTLICFLANLGSSYGMSLLATLTRLGTRAAEEKSLYQTALAQVFAICLPISIGGYLLAPQIIKLGYGGSYTNSVLALQILIWCIPLSVLRTVPWAALIARGHQRILLKVYLCSVIVNVVLNTLLVPKYGIYGAALATVITECLTGVLMLNYAARMELPFVSIQRFWRPTVASIFMAVVLVTFRPSNLLLGLVLGVVIYSLALMVLGGIRIRKGQFPALNV